MEQTSKTPESVKLSHVIGVGLTLFTVLSGMSSLDISRLTDELRHKDVQHQESIRQIIQREASDRKELYEELAKLYQQIALLKTACLREPIEEKKESLNGLVTNFSDYDFNRWLYFFY